MNAKDKVKLSVELKQVYGKPIAYPTNDAAKRLAGMLGTKTLTAKNLLDAAYLGMCVEIAGFKDAKFLADAMGRENAAGSSPVRISEAEAS